ncbi:beta-propeller domain-containing protein [bacterium]|nr:MAG: beta-propeller domain-containing protein [bacterium]
MNNKQRFLVFFLFLLLLLFFCTGTLILIKKVFETRNYDYVGIENQNRDLIFLTNFQKFSNELEFRDYLAKVYETRKYSFDGGMKVTLNDLTATPAESAPISIDRYSETNTRVVGIDEPDKVKTNGKSIFLSVENQDKSTRNWLESKIYPDFYFPYQFKTNVLNALPVEDLKQVAELETGGDMLLYNDILVVLDFTNYNDSKEITEQKIVGYNVSDPTNIQKIWQIDLDENQSYQEARIVEGKLVVTTSKYTANYENCVLPLYKIANEQLNLDCTSIYFPKNTYNSNNLTTITKFDLKTAKVEGTFSAMTNYSALIYMNQDNIYLSYPEEQNYPYIILDFLKTDGVGIFSNQVILRIEKILNYDISSTSKLNEIYDLMSKYFDSLDSDLSLKMSNDLNNKMAEYAKRNMRSLVATKVVKIDLKNMSVIAQGRFPGQLLNQYAIDEYKGNLRVATTIDLSTNFFLPQMQPSRRFNETAESLIALPSNNGSLSENDVYVLNEDLNVTGELTGLGLTERIYSARYIGDKLYLVTFRRTDPFYIIDLSDPKSPQKIGEFKIPGYSGYLHEIDENIILGVGMEGSNLKLSVFDVTNSAEPSEVSKYILNEYGSESLYNPHAFVFDPKYNLLFIPGYQGGYLFTIDEKYELKLQKAIDGYNVDRAIYINDYIYILSNNGEIRVFSEKTFDKVGEYNNSK